MGEAGVLEKTALVFGQMDEQPGTRLRVPLTALTMAEYFRDVQNQDVLLFIDNIFRFTRPDPRCPPCWVVCLPPWVTSRTWPMRWVPPGAHHLDPWSLDHLVAGHLRAGR